MNIIIKSITNLFLILILLLFSCLLHYNFFTTLFFNTTSSTLSISNISSSPFNTSIYQSSILLSASFFYSSIPRYYPFFSIRQSNLLFFSFKFYSIPNHLSKWYFWIIHTSFLSNILRSHLLFYLSNDKSTFLWRTQYLQTRLALFHSEYFHSSTIWI